MNKLLTILVVAFIAIFLKVLMSEEDSVANLLIHSYHPNASIPLDAPSRSTQQIRRIPFKGNITKLKHSEIKGPESIVPDPSANNVFYCGTADGRVIKITTNLSTNEINNNKNSAEKSNQATPVSTDIKVETISHVGGRPLGMEFDRNKNLIIAESVKGLVKLNVDSKEVHLLNTNYENGITRYANDLDISSPDKGAQIVYFSDSSAIRPLWQFSKGVWNTMRAATLDIASGVSSGRLLAYNTETKEVKELIKGIGYANGVALSKNGDFVLVVETARNRVLKYSLIDGTTSVFIDNLPYYPDGISRAKDGGFWVAMISPRMRLLDYFHPYKWAKYILFSLPDFVWPQAANNFGMVVRLTENGEVAEILEDNSGEIFAVTSVHETNDGKLLLGGLTQDYIAVFDYAPFRSKGIMG